MNTRDEIDFEHAPDPATSSAMHPATWCLDLLPGRRSAFVSCPAGHILTLYHHEIANNGAVTPAVVCPYRGCAFHGHVRLVGWVGR